MSRHAIKAVRCAEWSMAFSTDFVIVRFIGSNSSEKNKMQQDQEHHRGWVLPSGTSKGTMPPGLYLIATPIGNLGDISLRALDVLAAVDVVYCEDTRVSGKLLAHFGINKKLALYNDHSDENVRRAIFKKIEEGQCVALVSDAGMPLISDPGYKLVRGLRDAGMYVSSVPGANAPLTALQLSGLPSDQFAFLGFLPAKSEARRSVFMQWGNAKASLVAFESSQRLLACLQDVAGFFGIRRVSVVREISKKFEEVRSGSAQELYDVYSQQGTPKGEIVLVITPPENEGFSDVQIDALLRDALKTQSTKDAAAEIANVTGVSKKVLYQKALEMMKGREA